MLLSGSVTVQTGIRRYGSAGSPPWWNVAINGEIPRMVEVSASPRTQLSDFRIALDSFIEK